MRKPLITSRMSNTCKRWEAFKAEEQREGWADGSGDGGVGFVLL